MSHPRKSCPACKGSGWTQAPTGRVLEREDGSKVAYSSVVRCSCENSITIPEDPPAEDVFGQPKKLDAQRRASGERSDGS